jgi:hypothetical protein
MFKKTLLILSLLFASGCAKNNSVADFEKIGFSKKEQPFFQMVGAIDGWKGTFKDSQVEIYIYESKSKIPQSQLQNLAKQGGSSLCVVNNVAVIDYGTGDFCSEVLSKIK